MKSIKIRRKLTNWIFHMRFRTCFFLISSILLFYGGILVMLQVWKEMNNKNVEYEFEVPHKWSGDFKGLKNYVNYLNTTYSPIDVQDPVILWWTPFTGVKGETKKCGDVKCFFTENRRFKSFPMTKLILFYGTRFNPFDLPLPRNGTTVDWALLHEESPKNTPILLHEETLELFNYSATFSRHSDFPLTLQYLKDKEVLTGDRYLVPTNVKDDLLSDLAPVVYVHSDCATPLDRDAYVSQLMKYIPVDSYGKCVQNRKLPAHLSDLTKSDAEEFLQFVSRYKFTLTFENAVCEDYVTEKLWRPLIVGSVPVYLGSPSVKDWLPNNISAIIASDFQSPKHLAEYLLRLNSDRHAYEAHLQHKLAVPPAPRITNRNLLAALERRSWGIDNDFEKGNFIEHYECYLCRQLHERSSRSRRVVDKSHYDCHNPVSPLTGRPDPTNWWTDQWKSSKCEAKVLRDFVDTETNINTHEEFFSALKRFIVKGLC